MSNSAHPPVSLKYPVNIMQVRLNPQERRYREIQIGERHGWLKGQLTKLTLLSHQRPDPEMMSLDIVALDEFIMDERFAAELTLPEIAWAFMRGIRGQYGEFYGLTAASLYGFIDGYLASPEKQESARLVRIAKGVEKPKNAGAVDYLKAVDQHRAEVWAERLKDMNK